jgi:cytochrome c556
MKVSNKLAVLGASLVSLLVVACSQGGGSAAVDDSPEGRAVTYRHGVMRSVEWKVVQLRGMAQGEITVDETAFKKHAGDLATLAGMITEGFIPNSGTTTGSNALPDVWTNMTDFQQKGREFQTAAQGLADAANNGGFAAAQGMVQSVAQGCGNCHRPYRRREE